MSLFERKTFIMHSGEVSDFKIECDELTEEDLETLALLISRKYDFCLAIGVPTGGERLAEALMKYENHLKSDITLIVDDVLTTGASMEEFHYDIEGKENVGVVIFARGECPDWVTPIFKLWEQ